MAVRKVLVAVGLVCVLAPAALAMMRPYQAGHGEAPGQQFAQDIFDQLHRLLDFRGTEARAQAEAGPAEVRLPFWKLAHVVYPGLFSFDGTHPQPGGDEPFAGDLLETSYAALGEPVGQQTAAAGQEGPTDRSDYSSAGSRGVLASGAGGFGGFGAASGQGGSGGGDAAQLALALDPEGLAGSDGTLQDPTRGAEVTVMPLPASVWMLMASILGLAFVGSLARSRSA